MGLRIYRRPNVTRVCPLCRGGAEGRWVKCCCGVRVHHECAQELELRECPTPGCSNSHAWAQRFAPAVVQREERRLEAAWQQAEREREGEKRLAMAACLTFYLGIGVIVVAKALGVKTQGNAALVFSLFAATSGVAWWLSNPGLAVWRAFPALLARIGSYEIALRRAAWRALRRRLFPGQAEG